MAKIKLNPAIAEIRGKVGDVVFKKSKNGEIIMTKAPDMTHVQWSPAQKAQRQRIKQANAFAKAAMADLELRAQYEQIAEEQATYPYNAARNEYFRTHKLVVK